MRRSEPQAPARRTPPIERRRVSTSSRAVPMLMAFVGMAIVVATQAAQRGLLTGVEIGPMAYVVGGVLIVLGVLGVGRGESGAPDATGTGAGDDGPIRESGRDAEEADEEARLRETLREIDRIRRSTPPAHDR